MPEKTKRPRTEAQKAATAKLVASNKAKREAKKALLANTPDSARRSPISSGRSPTSGEAAEAAKDTPVEENVKLAIAKVAEESPESESETESESESEPENERVPQPADFSGEAHHVAKDVRERVEGRARSVSSTQKPIRRSRSVSNFRYGKNKNLIDY